MKLYGFRYYPAAWSAALTTVLGAVVAFHFMTQTTASYVSASVVAVLGVITAATTRPWVPGTVAAALGVFLTSLAGFGLHLDDQQIGGVVGLAALILMLFVHPNVTPKAGSPSLLDPRLAVLAHTAAAGLPPRETIR